MIVPAQRFFGRDSLAEKFREIERKGERKRAREKLREREKEGEIINNSDYDPMKDTHNSHAGISRYPSVCARLAG